MFPAAAYRYWSFRRQVFLPDGPLAAVGDADQFFVNGQPIPNDVVHTVRTVFGFGYVGIYLHDRNGNYQFDVRGDDIGSVKLWGRVTLRPRPSLMGSRLGPDKGGINPPATEPKPRTPVIGQNPAQ